MRIPSPDSNPASASSDYSSALAQFLDCQAVQSCADDDVQAALQALTAATVELPQALAARLSHIFDATLAYAHWANRMDNDFFDAEEAVVLAEQGYGRLASATQANSPSAPDTLRQADAARLAAAQALEARAVERALASEELESATDYLDRFRREGNVVVQEEIQDLRDVWQHAVDVAQEAQLATQSALERLQFFLRMDGDHTAEVPLEDAAPEGQEFSEDSEHSSASFLSDAADSDGADLLADCVAAVIGSLSHMQLGGGNPHASI